MSMDENVLSDITVFNLAPKDFIRNITDAMESVYSALECPVTPFDQPLVCFLTPSPW